MSDKLILHIIPNAGYAADQVEGMTLADLRDLIDQAIADHGEDAEVVTYDAGSWLYGAKYGRIATDDAIQLDEDPEVNY